MMFCDLQYVEESLAVVGKLVYADWLLVLSLYKTMKNLENIEKYIRTCGDGAGILLFLLSCKIRLNMGSFSYS